MRRLLLFLSTTSYRTEAFVQAASELDEPVSLTVASDRRNALEHLTGGTTFAVAFDDAVATLRAVRQNEAGFGTFSAVVSADDESNLVAAQTAAALGLPFHSVDAVIAASDKATTRRAMAAAGLPGPEFVLVPRADVEGAIRGAAALAWPRVLKPTRLSMSRGVLRADDERGFRAAYARVDAILDDGGGELLVETYLPGGEVAVEGIVNHGELTVLAIFDKPDPLEGPTFEETIYLTPSRLGAEAKEAVVDAVNAGCRALGLRHGPIHAEVRLTDAGPVVLEVAARSIGGQCSRVFTWALGESLEVVIYRQALGLPVDNPPPARPAGVLMLPVSRAGELVSVDVSDAEALPGVRAISITHAPGPAVPLPEGSKYLGFVFADGDTVDAVEQTLRKAWAAIRVDMV